jgi:MFS family permease
MSHPAQVVASREVRAESGIRGDRRRRAAFFVIGFGSFPNLNAVQPLLPLFRQLFHASEMRVSSSAGISALAVALTAPVAGLVSKYWGRPSGKASIRPAGAG